MGVEEQIKLLGETLKFYAEQANYSNNQIKLDNGHLARHAIKLIDENKKLIQSAENLYDEYTKLREQNLTEQEAIEAMIEIKKIQDGW